MKKLAIMSFFILLLAACNSSQDTSPAEIEDTEQEEQSEDAVETEIENETEENTETEAEEPVEEEVDSTPEEDSTEDSESEDPETEEHEDLVDVTYDIFAAQNELDYDFLNSILSKGSKLDKENNTFSFENVTYPHEQEFLTEKNARDLEFRYTHENDDGSVIVGLAAMNHEEGYSYVIDFTYIQEDGKWKMNDMDINK